MKPTLKQMSVTLLLREAIMSWAACRRRRMSHFCGEMVSPNDKGYDELIADIFRTMKTATEMNAGWPFAPKNSKGGTFF